MIGSICSIWMYFLDISFVLMNQSMSLDIVYAKTINFAKEPKQDFLYFCNSACARGNDDLRDHP